MVKLYYLLLYQLAQQPPSSYLPLQVRRRLEEQFLQYQVTTLMDLLKKPRKGSLRFGTICLTMTLKRGILIAMVMRFGDVDIVTSSIEPLEVLRHVSSI